MRRLPLRRLALHALGALALSMALVLVLAIIVSHMILQSGPHTHARTGLAQRTGIGGAGPGGDPRAGGGAAGAARIPHLLAAPRPEGTPVSVAVAAHPAGAATPADFLGLSFELRSLPAIARYATATRSGTASARIATGDLAALLRSLGPGVLRFGGVSADEQAAWVPGGSTANGAGRLPPWASTAVTPHELAGIAVLARTSGWRVLLTVNLGHYDPAAAAQEAAAARSALGSYLAGLELGNEPDRYVRKGLRAPGWDFAAYRAQAAAYRTAIAAAAPGVPIAGPDPSSGVPGLAWLRGAAGTLHPDLLTDHYYPLSSCGARPTIGELLSPALRRQEDEMLTRMLTAARAAARPLRIDETNSISCEGQPGVSDSFASALWALDYTARALATGVEGVNFHDLLAKPGAYSPLVAPDPAALAAGALRAAPEWYALLAARELPGSRPLPTSVLGEAAIGEQLSASAFRAPDGRLRFVLVDYDPPGSAPLAVRLRVPPAPADGSQLPSSAVGRPGSSAGSARTGGAPVYTGGSVLRLTAPSPAATAGVRLGGRAVPPGGSWTAPAALPAVYARAGALSVQMPPSSAAVVTLYPG